MELVVDRIAMDMEGISRLLHAAIHLQIHRQDFQERAVVEAVIFFRFM